jgi:hypothetical protein
LIIGYDLVLQDWFGVKLFRMINDFLAVFIVIGDKITTGGVVDRQTFANVVSTII